MNYIFNFECKESTYQDVRLNAIVGKFQLNVKAVAELLEKQFYIY